MKILVVDDEIRIRELIKEYLLMEDYEVVMASDGLEALDVINSEEIDLMILDVMMPNLDGFSLLKESEIKIPTIVLSARTGENDKLEGFDYGIDDYVTKPFSPKELVARVKSLAARTGVLKDTFTYKELVIDYGAHTVSIKEKEIELTPKEYDLLVYLIKNKNLALSREQILINVWDYDYYGEDRTVDTHIKSLRKAIGKYRENIKTVRGVGYKFETK